MSALRDRVQVITAEYWAVRDEQSERVAVAQLALALARAEAAAAAGGGQQQETEETSAGGRP